MAPMLQGSYRCRAKDTAFCYRWALALHRRHAGNSCLRPLLAVVDLGSNSFRLQIGRVEGDQIYQLDTWRETLRLGAGARRQGPAEAAPQC